MLIMGTGVGLFGVYKISESNKHLDTVVENAFLPYQDLKNLSFMFGSTLLLDIEKLTNNELNQEFNQIGIKNKIIEAEALLEKIESYPHSSLEEEYNQKIKQNIQKIKIRLDLLINQAQKNQTISKTEFSQLVVLFNDLQTKLDVLMNLQVKKVRLAQKENQALFSESKLYFVYTLLVGVGISIILALLFLIGIKANISSTSRLIQKIASGNISTDIERRGNKDFGELQENLRFLSTKFTEILEISQSAANNISNTSKEMSTSSQMISTGANQQAASVEEIAASMEQISSRIQENTENTIATKKISEKVVSDIEGSSKNVKQTASAIQGIADKISIIGDIAFQTNILALNAAVEAARAGEHGKGFGVVAAAVGKLADRSKAAALDITSLSESGVSLAQESHKSLSQFVSEITETSNLIAQITTANLEQNEGIGGINSSIQMLNQITQQNAATSEEMATVSEEMEAQAQTLNESIQYFRFHESNTIKAKRQKYLKSSNKKNT
jgi:methyl-accepting chemotaxis protein